MAAERNIDFDTITDRTHTDCLKYDFAVRRGRPEGILPLWVADMDFPTSEHIIRAVQERAAHGIFGYTESGSSYYEAVAAWMRERHDWETDETWLVKTPGVVFALAMAVKAYTEVGDAVLVQQPVYYPFTEVITDNRRRVVSSDLVLGQEGDYQIDFADFEEKIVREKIRLFFLCSPHNPVGRVWTREELMRIGEICVRHRVLVVADEIHEDFVFGEHAHVVYASLGEQFQKASITCTSPGKTFNLAGLQISNIWIPDEQLRVRFQKEIAAAGYSQLNTLGLTACEAAYREGQEWYDAMMEYVRGNIRYTREFVERELPDIRVREPEGTYLMWLDFRKLGLDEEELEDLIVKKAGLWLDSGAIFGPTGEGYERINVACPRAILTQALEQLRAAVRSEKK